MFAALFVVYIFFCFFSLLNLVTGVFVDGAIQHSGKEKELQLTKEQEEREEYVSMLLDLLEDIDTEDTGFITKSDLEMALKDTRVLHTFAVLDIDIMDSNYLFNVLDKDNSGAVDMEEFVEGCMRIKGAAKTVDIHILTFEIQVLRDRVDLIISEIKPSRGVYETGSEALQRISETSCAHTPIGSI